MKTRRWVYLAGLAMLMVLLAGPHTCWAKQKVKAIYPGAGQAIGAQPAQPQAEEDTRGVPEDYWPTVSQQLGVSFTSNTRATVVEAIKLHDLGIKKIRRKDRIKIRPVGDCCSSYRVYLIRTKKAYTVTPAPLEEAPRGNTNAIPVPLNPFK